MTAGPAGHAAASPAIAADPAPAKAGVLQAGSGFIGNAGITLVGAGIGAVLALGNEVLAARFLGVASYGLYALALMLAKVGEILAVFGLPLSVLHYLPLHLSRKEAGQALGTILGAILLPVTLGIGFAVLLWFGSDWIATNLFNHPQAGRFIAVVGLAIPLLASADLLGNAARGFGRALPFVLIRNLTPPLCYLGVLVSLLVWRGPEIGAAFGYVAGVAAGVLLGTAIVASLVRRHLGLPRPVMQVGRLYRYAAPVALNSVVSLALVWTDLCVLTLFTDAATIGIYRGCMQIVLGFDLVWNACSAATAPIYPVLLAERRHAQLQATYSAAVRVSTLLAIPIVLLVVVNSADLLRLLGPGFAAGAWALAVLACGQFLKVVFGNASVVLIVGGRQSLEAANGAIAATLNLVLNLLLVPRHGLIGAAIATAISLTVLGQLRSMQLHRVMNLRTVDPTILRMGLVTAVLAGAIWIGSAAAGVAPGSGFPAFIARVGAMILLIGASLWTLCLKREDRAELLRAVLRRRAAATP